MIFGVRSHRPKTSSPPPTRAKDTVLSKTPSPTAKRMSMPGLSTVSPHRRAGCTSEGHYFKRRQHQHRRSSPDVFSDDMASSASLAIEQRTMCPSIPTTPATRGSANLVMKRDTDRQGRLVYKIVEKQLMGMVNSKNPAATIEVGSLGERMSLRDEFGHLSARVFRKRCRASRSPHYDGQFRYKVYATRPVYEGQRKSGPALYLWADIKGSFRHHRASDAPYSQTSIMMHLKQPVGPHRTVSSSFAFERTCPSGSSLRLRQEHCGWTAKQLWGDGTNAHCVGATNIVKSIETHALSTIDDVCILRNDTDPTLILCLLAISQQVAGVQ